MEKQHLVWPITKRSLVQVQPPQPTSERYSADMTTPTLVPPIEENIPLPENAKDAFPELTAEQELQMRANVVKLMSDLTGQELAPTQENADQAKAIAKEMMTNPAYRPDYAKYPNETLAMLAGMVAQMNVSIVDELSDLKMYVVNKLVAEVEAAKEIGRAHV